MFYKKGQNSDYNGLTIKMFSVAGQNDVDKLTGPKIISHFGLRWWPKNVRAQKASFNVTSDNVPF